MTNNLTSKTRLLVLCVRVFCARRLFARQLEVWIGSRNLKE